MIFDLPLFIAGLVSLIGIVGLIAAVIALRGVQRELTEVNRFDDGLREQLLEQVSTPEFRIRNWVKEKAFPLDSHLAEQIIAVHNGWMRGRAPGLGELHNLAGRRERSRLSARLAGGIAATLLICGIGGTLFSIHPILGAFRIGVDSNGAVQEASQSARDVVTMVQGLGRAFYPSLAALFWTVVVVSARGLYVQTASRLARALDSVAFDYFLPKFSPRTISEDFSELSAKLSGVADKMSERDSAFAATAESLAQSIEEIKKLGPVVQKAGDDASKASTKLAKDTTNVVTAFAKHLAEDSPLFTAVGDLKDSVNATNLSVNQLKDVANGFTATNRESADIIAKLALALKEAIDSVPEVIRIASDNGAKEISNAGVEISDRAKENANSLMERLAKLLDATTAKIETVKTDLGRVAPAVSAELDNRIKTSVGGLLSAVEKSTTDLDAAAGRLSRAAERLDNAGASVDNTGFGDQPASPQPPVFTPRGNIPFAPPPPIWSSPGNNPPLVASPPSLPIRVLPPTAPPLPKPAIPDRPKPVDEASSWTRFLRSPFGNGRPTKKG